MNEYWLVGLLTVVLVFASLLMTYPLRTHRVLRWAILPVVLFCAAFGYMHWGSFAEWQEQIQHVRLRAQAQKMMKQLKSPQELIDKLRAKLDDSPQSAKGWYLLGKLYSSQQAHEQAKTAFAKAHQLKPDEEQYTVFFAHSLWMLNKEQFNDEVRTVFHELLAKNPKQPDALAMLAMDAYLANHNSEAIGYWERLLQLAPPQSEEADAIRKAIAKAAGK